MHRIFKIAIALVVFVNLFACKKTDKTSESPITATFEESKVICYPFDTTSVSLKIVVSGGKAPYSISWDQTIKKGTGPFAFLFKTTTDHVVTVNDANGNSKVFYYTLYRKNYDSLVNDYRNAVIGEYDGVTCFSERQSIGSTNTFTTISTARQPIHLTVSKSPNFRFLTISGITEDLYYDYRKGTLAGGNVSYFVHRGSFFKGDSLICNYSPSTTWAWKWQVFETKKKN